MGPMLKSLVELQRIEIELRRTRKKLDRGQKRIDAQKQKIQQLKSALAAKKEEIKLTQVQYNELDVELKTDDAKIAKLRTALNAAKTNKDYSAILTQINTDKADKSKLEEQLLAMLGQIETEQGACRDIEDMIAKETGLLEEIAQQVQEKAQAVQDTLEEQIKQHQQALEAVPADTADLFMRLSERFDGEVLAELAKRDGAKGDFTCGGCYMKMPLERVNTLMCKDEIVICPTCGRIMILESQMAHG